MDVAVFHRTISMQDPNRLWGELRSFYESDPDQASCGREEGFIDGLSWGPAEHHLGLAVRRAPNVTDYRRADESADPGPVPQDVRGIQHCDRAAIAAHDEAFPGGGGMSHRATVHVGDVTHVGNGETDVCHLMAPGEN